MPSAVSNLRIAAVTGLGLAAAVLAFGETLINSSPFVQGNAPPPAPTAMTDGPIQLSAVLPLPDGTFFGIYSPQLKRTRFVKLGEPGRFQENSPLFTVRSTRVFEGVEQVTVDYQGSSLILALKSSKVASSSTPAAGQPGAAPRGPTPAAVPAGPAGIQPARGAQAAAPAPGGRGGGQPGQPPGGRGGGAQGAAPGGGRGAVAATPDQVAAANAAFQNMQSQRQQAQLTGQPAVVTNPNANARGGANRGAAAPTTGRRGN